MARFGLFWENKMTGKKEDNIWAMGSGINRTHYQT
jgi:hypothetical protein